MKIKADLLFQYNLLPIESDDIPRVDNVLSEYNTTDLMGVLDTLNANEFDIPLVSIDLINGIVTVFSTSFPSIEQVAKFWQIADLTAPQQTIINDFIALL